MSITIWFGTTVPQVGRKASNHAARAQELQDHRAPKFPEIRDPKSLVITLDAVGDAIHFFHYSLSIYGDGRVEYDGRLGTFVPGLHRSHASEGEILQLIEAFREADFFSLRDESALLVVDAPRFTIALTVDGQEKTVTDRLGESKAFHELMDRIVDLSHARRWLENTAETLPTLLTDPESLNAADDNGRTVLMWACQHVDGAAVRELIRLGADVRAKDGDGRSPLMYAAAAAESPEMLDELLHSGADIHERDSAGETALHFAVGLVSTRNLLDFDMGYRTHSSAYPWPDLFSPRSPKPDVVRFLLAAGADPNAADSQGATPLMYAAEEANTEILGTLLSAGEDLNAQDTEGRTALMDAADHCQTESVRYLLRAGANPKLRDNNRRTALGRVRRNPRKDWVRFCGTSRKQIIHLLEAARTPD